MLGYLFAFLAAWANATSSVLQRDAGEEEETEQELSPGAILQLIKKPVWLFGILAVFTGFLLQATALSFGQLASVEPVLILELPITIVLAWKFLGESIGKKEVGAVVAMTIGLAGLIYFLSPTGGKHGRQVDDWVWAVALAVGFGVIAALAVCASRTSGGMKRAALYGAATGAGFGVTAGLMKGMTEQASNGIAHVFAAWQLYLMIAAGGLSMYLLQNAMNAGKLVASQPGFTLVDPVVAILWGVLVFREHVRHGLFLVLAIVSFAVMVAAVIVLSRSEHARNDDAARQKRRPAERRKPTPDDAALREDGRPPAAPAAQPSGAHAIPEN